VKAVTVAFLWHLHQPLYRPGGDAACALPWVRLHGLRSYYDMPRVLEEFPEIRVTLNLTCTLLDQLLAYAEGGTDLFLELAAVPASDLGPDQRAFLIDHAFAADRHAMIGDLPRFAELLQRRDRARRLRGPAEAWKEFADADYRDLQVLFDLAWFGFKAREDFPLLRDLRRRGRGFTQDDLRALHAVETQVLARLLPLYREAAARGQAEIATSPYAHPILPLLIDTDSARETMPGAALPARFRRPADARAQVSEALDRAERLLGARPRGMWPSEAALGHDALRLLGECGVGWTASGEQVLAAAERDGPADARRVWSAGDGTPAIVFRDHDLSDRIGFNYAGVDAARAVADLLAGVRQRAGRAAGGLVLIALDGENPWERYPRAGADFLRALYGDLRRAGDLEVCTVGEAVAARPERAPIRRLRAGSWIQGDLSTWIGSPEKNRAWDLLGRIRGALDGPLGDPRLPEAARAAAWAALRAAEGSDWFWWLDAGHPNPDQPRFDEAFRGHLRRACEALGVPPPADLDWPIPAPRPAGDDLLRPGDPLLDPRIDGYEGSYFEWRGAQVHHAAALGSSSSMQRARRRIAALHVAFTRDRELALRFDPDSDEGPEVFMGLGLDLSFRTEDGVRRLALDLDDSGDLAAARPGGGPPGRGRPPARAEARAEEKTGARAEEGTGTRAGPPAGVRAAARKILEVAIPYAAAGLRPGHPAGLLIRLRTARGEAALREVGLRVPEFPRRREAGS
jgi:alpha-amylase/alpha-mannosidase (GH57 family)